MTLPVCERPKLNLISTPNSITRSSSSAATATSVASGIPKLTDILQDKVDPQCIYSKPHFLKFLLDKHCFENYDLLTHIESIKENYDYYQRHNSTADWYSVYNQFIETDIVNLPADVTSHLSKHKLPDIKTLNFIEKTLLNYLRDSYYEFLSINKPLSARDIHKTCSTPSTATTTSTSTSADTCFTKINYVSSPDSHSICSDESSSFNIINKLNGTIINKNILDSIDDNEMFHYEKEPLESDEEAERDNDLSFLRQANNALGPNTKSLYAVDDLTIDSNYSSESNQSAHTVVNKPASLALSPLVTQELASANAAKSWSKFTNKLKWRRRSSH